MKKSYIEVRVPFRFDHRWKNAPKSRKYLKEYHPHNFEIRLEIQVFETDREIEFHDMQDWLYTLMLNTVDSLHNDSCETIATKILTSVQARLGKNRSVQVEVWEDESVGGKVKYEPDTKAASQS